MNLFALLVAWLLGNFGRGMRWRPALVRSCPRMRGSAVPVEGTVAWATTVSDLAGSELLLAALAWRKRRPRKLSGSVRFSFSDARFTVDSPWMAGTAWLGSFRSKTG